MQYRPIHAGEWITPRRKYYYAKCCDCGARHKVEFRVKKERIQFRAWRIDKKTNS